MPRDGRARDPSLLGEGARGQRAAVDQRHQHGGTGRLADQTRDLGDIRVCCSFGGHVQSLRRGDFGLGRTVPGPPLDHAEHRNPSRRSPPTAPLAMAAARNLQRLLHGHSRHHGRQRGAAAALSQHAREHLGPAVDRRRLQPQLRGAAAERGDDQRRARCQTRLHRRNRAVLPLFTGLRSRPRRRPVDRRPCRSGHRRGDVGPGVAVADPGDLQRPWRSPARARRLGRRGRDRRWRRAGSRRPARVRARVARGVLRQRAAGRGRADPRQPGCLWPPSRARVARTPPDSCW